MALDRGEHGIGVRTKYDDGAADGCRGGHREQCVLEQRTAIQRRELLGRAETPPRARCEDQSANGLRRFRGVRRLSGRMSITTGDR